MKKSVKAYLTVEASFVISMTIIVMGILLSLCFYKYQCCWYTQAVCQCLITGSNQGILKEEDSLRQTINKWNHIKDEFYLIPDQLSVEINGDDEQVEMQVKGNTTVWGKDSLIIEIDESLNIIKPTKFIRKLVALKKEE